MNNPPENIVIFPEWLTHLGFAFAVIFAIVGVIGNSITICALLKSMRTRCQATTVFIISLSVSDLIFCAFNLPMTASRYYYRAWRLGTFLCQMFPFFFYANVASSLLSIVAITINRFILVQFPHRYSSIYRPRTLVCMIAAIWLISLATLVPTLGGWWGEFGLDKRTFSCTILSKNGCSPKKFLMSTGVLLPCLIVVVCYALIYRKIRASRKALLLHSGSSSITDASGNRRHRDNARLTRTVAAIFIAFLMCFFPLMIVNVFDNDKESSSKPFEGRARSFDDIIHHNKGSKIRFYPVGFDSSKKAPYCSQEYICTGEMGSKEQ